MLILLGIAMAMLPPSVAWLEHMYLRHGEVSGKKKILFFLLYFASVHGVVLSTVFLRGIRRLSVGMITVDYEIRHLGLGLVYAFIFPFFVCLLFEADVTIKAVLGYYFRFITDSKKYRQYVVRSAKAYLQAEVTRSYLDWLWWVMEPFCMMLIYTFIFGYVFGSNEPYFPVFVFIGLTMWNFFSRNVSYGVTAIQYNKGIITKIYLPKYMLLVSHMLRNGFKMAISFGIVLVMMVFFRVRFTWCLLCSFPMILALFLFTFAVGTILMHYGVYVSDLSYIVGIALNMLMYLSGIFYSMKRFPAPFDVLLGKFNPIAFFINSLRDAVLYGIMPDWTAYTGWMCISLIMACIGIYTIYHNENAYVKVI